ncbi:iron dependent repressor [Gottschalkia acidurici 9a]|uniref:Iron dependent repressor n=1 Tax=Gottschalkia acidurici (strain ATCC 7906 / DSM 604 / BCRC 14475 / CIP 104303 / KCTC 5404 / NCIMB 10678 / 9a) TaxID=1128398 RepID=K0AZJ7_GOTA9|nr:iron dependent repressor, metal binding and dimerization domain protein [Gottschalkia acidurici]AFS79223.1 iron dependent repressor [Gottschalkia acidurici 9a]
MLSPSLEDYLEELYRLKVNNKEIRVKDIAYCLDVSMPSVVNGLRRLGRLDYIIYEPYEKIEITEKGKKKGKFLVMRNKILKDFIDVIESDCDSEKEAEAMEHYLSISTIKCIEKMVAFLKNNTHILDKMINYEIESQLND